MSRKDAPTVNTGGELGQILDHLVCSSDLKARRSAGMKMFRLHKKACNKVEELEEALRYIHTETVLVKERSGSVMAIKDRAEAALGIGPYSSISATKK